MIELSASNQLIARAKIRIPFYDIDMAGIVWHGHYLKYFELARCALLDGIGYNYQEMISTGVLWPVVDTTIRYLHPLVLDQEVLVSALLQEWELRLVIDYRILDEKGVVCSKGTTVQAPVDAKTKVLQIGSPELLVNKVEKCLQSQAEAKTR
jgi:acyl-CoA thioester hydrolase